MRCMQSKHGVARCEVRKGEMDDGSEVRDARSLRADVGRMDRMFEASVLERFEYL